MTTRRSSDLRVIGLKSGSNRDTRGTSDRVKGDKWLVGVITLDRKVSASTFTPSTKHVIAACGVVQVDLDGVKPAFAVVENSIRIYVLTTGSIKVDNTVRGKVRDTFPRNTLSSTVSSPVLRRKKRVRTE